MLALLDEQARHGYDIIRAIEQRTGGAYCPSPGVNYPTLALLEDGGHVRAETADGARNRYQITPDGCAFLVENKALIDALLSRMQHVGAVQGSASPAIIAAMDGLKWRSAAVPALDSRRGEGRGRRHRCRCATYSTLRNKDKT